jgi:hypothetical protein
MADREPVSFARVEKFQQPMRGFTQGFLSLVPVLHHVENLRNGDEACLEIEFPNPEKEYPRAT